MKKFHKLIRNINIVGLLFLVFGCTDNDIEPIFNRTINERTSALKAEYINALTSPENGWIGYYSPNRNFGYYTILMDFDEDGSVKINSDYNSGNDDNTITYRLDKTLKIELVLETYAVFHEIFSINNNNNGGEFVFNILSATNNEIVLESKFDFGDDVTIFKLRRARPTELDINPVYTSVQNISEDEREALVSNILFNDDVIGKFSFNPLTRFAIVSYTSEEGIVRLVNVPIIITLTGFVFVEPLSINGIVLTSFEYNEAENLYENPADALKIIYNSMPYNFGVSHEAAVFNIVEFFKSSPLFNLFFQDFSENLPVIEDTGQRLQILNILFRELNTIEIPYIIIETNRGNVFYDIDIDFDSDTRIVKFSLTGNTNASDESTAILQPLLDVFIGSELGYFVEGSGSVLFTNTTFTMINLDNPDYKIDFWTF